MHGLKRRGIFRFQRVHSVNQLVEPLAASCARADHGNSELTSQSGYIYTYFLSPCLIHKIYTDDGARCYLDYLQNEIEVSLQTGGIAHRDAGVGFSAQDKVPRHFLFNRVREERICAGEVYRDIIFSVARECAAGGSYRFSRPVSRVLIHAGQGVEHRALSDVRISRESYYNVIRVLFRGRAV